MCGRYQAWVEDDELVRIIEREKKGNGLRYFRRNEVFPGSEVPVIYGSYANVRAHISVWGYKSVNDGTHGRLIINARSESALEKLMFKNAVSNSVPGERRILVLTSGYYEWKNESVSAGKVRYHIRSEHASAPLLLCGLEYDQQDGGRRHVILTSSAYGNAARIHDRMPLICPREYMRSWLYDNDFAVRVLEKGFGVDQPLKCTV